MTQETERRKYLERIFNELENVNTDVRFEKLEQCMKAENLQRDIQAASPLGDIAAERRYERMNSKINTLQKQQTLIATAMFCVSRAIGKNDFEIEKYIM